MTATPASQRIWHAYKDHQAIYVVPRDNEPITQEDVDWVIKTLISARIGRPMPGPASMPTVGEGAVGPAQREVIDLEIPVDIPQSQRGVL